MTVLVDCFVAGKPVTQGSKTRTRWGIRDDNADRLKPWRESVRADVRDRLPDGWTPYEGPVTVHLTFGMLRPASHPKRRRTWPTGAGSGDIDKLSRACLDAIEAAGVIRNDAQVTVLVATKDWDETAGVDLTVSTGFEADQVVPVGDFGARPVEDRELP